MPLGLTAVVTLAGGVIRPYGAGASLRFCVSRAGPRPPSRSGRGPRPFPSPPARFSRSLLSLVLARALRAAVATLPWESGMSGSVPAAFRIGRSLRSRPLLQAAVPLPSRFLSRSARPCVSPRLPARLPSLAASPARLAALAWLALLLRLVGFALPSFLGQAPRVPLATGSLRSRLRGVV